MTGVAFHGESLTIDGTAQSELPAGAELILHLTHNDGRQCSHSHTGRLDMNYYPIPINHPCRIAPMDWMAMLKSHIKIEFELIGVNGTLDSSLIELLFGSWRATFRCSGQRISSGDHPVRFDSGCEIRTWYG